MACSSGSERLIKVNSKLLMNKTPIIQILSKPLQPMEVSENMFSI